MSSIPEDVCQFGRKQTALKEPFSFVIEADASVLHRQSHGTSKCEATHKSRHTACGCAVLIGLICEISGKELVGPFSAQSDGRMSPRKLRKKPGRQRSCICAGFVRVI